MQPSVSYQSSSVRYQSTISHLKSDISQLSIYFNAPILMLLYIMLYIVLAYLMLFAALTNAVCLYNASFLPLISANAFYFHALSLFIDT